MIFKKIIKLLLLAMVVIVLFYTVFILILIPDLIKEKKYNELRTQQYHECLSKAGEVDFYKPTTEEGKKCIYEFTDVAFPPARSSSKLEWLLNFNFFNRK